MVYISPGRAVAARGAHNPEVGGSNPPPATNLRQGEGCHSELLAKNGGKSQ